MEKRIWQDIKDWLILKEQEFHPSNDALNRIVILVLYPTHKIIESYSITNNSFYYKDKAQNWLNNLFKRYESDDRDWRDPTDIEYSYERYYDVTINQ
jgi:hypothetical protein